MGKGVNMRKIGVVLLLVVSLTGCGHKDYKDFMNNTDTDMLGVLALVCAVVFGFAFFIANRYNDSNGPASLPELVFMTAFMVTFSAGLAWANDPSGWLTMTTPTIDRF